MNTLLRLNSNEINHDNQEPQQTPTVADPQTISVPRRLLCNRLEVLIHLTLLRVMWGDESGRGQTAGRSVRQLNLCCGQTAARAGLAGQ